METKKARSMNFCFVNICKLGPPVDPGIGKACLPQSSRNENLQLIVRSLELCEPARFAGNVIFP